MDIQFVPQTAWRARGAPRIEVPGEIQEWMDRCYRDGELVELVIEPGENVGGFERLLRAHATHRGLAAKIQHFRRDGKNYIRFGMADKRGYATGAPREQR